MAKYIVIEDFEAQWLRPPLTTPQIAVFKKDSVIQALPYPGGTLKTRVDGTQPSGKAGEILVDVVESKVKMLPDDDAEKLKKDEQKKKIVQYAIYGAGALFLWWFIYGKNRKKTKTLSGVSNKELDKVIVYDNGGKSFDRYTIFTPDGSVYGMSENATGFNLYVGDETEIPKGRHLGKRLKSVPDSIKKAVIDRMS